MKRSLLLLVCSASFLLGCGKSDDVTVTGPDGTSLTTSRDGKNMTFTDEKGNKGSVQTDANGNVTVNDGKGGTSTLNTGNLSEADLGVPFYGGSTETTGGSSSMEANGEKVVTSMRTTKDDPGKVSDFYKDKVRAPSTSNSSAGDMKVFSLSGKLENDADISISATKQGAEDTKILIVVKSKK